MSELSRIQPAGHSRRGGVGRRRYLASLSLSISLHAGAVGLVVALALRPIRLIDAGQSRASLSSAHGLILPRSGPLPTLPPEAVEPVELAALAEPRLEPVFVEPDPFVERAFEPLPEWSEVALASRIPWRKEQPALEEPTEDTPEEAPDEVAPLPDEPELASAEPDPGPGPEAAESSQGEPQPADCPKPPYPRLSIRRGEEGTVLCRLHVDEHGRVVRVELVRSSGHRRLDEAALETLETWRFRPATRAGCAVSAELDHEVEFRLGDARARAAR